ncbi:MAG: PSD1 and planctomycete cytochrome C domain-containing protein, partial [Planctomycetota bacterium]
MKRRTRTLSHAWLTSLGVLVVTSHANAAVDFKTHVLPILSEQCMKCHSADKPEAGLNLTSFDTATAPLKTSHHAIVPGAPDASELIARVTHSDPKERMPRDEDPLSDEQIQTLRQWIAEGADWPSHWAYEPIIRPTPPRVNNQNAIRNPIDGFVIARLEDADIEPSPEADRYTQIKRLYYDLLGLPAPPEEADAFANDTDPKAYEKLVDRLLASPHFGERWGRHWLDIARYADSDGYEKDNPRRNAWRYRDWVIQAINDDLPFDRFTVEQLAGDLIPNATDDQKLATAFHRQTLTNTEGGTDQEEWRCEAIFDRVETTGSAWMGLTLACAKCHSHKYDAVSQQEYYQLFAFFDNTDETTMDVVISDEAKADYDRKLAAHNASLKGLRAELKAAEKAIAGGFDAWAASERRRVIEADKAPVMELTRAVAARSVSKPAQVALERQPDGSWLATGDSPDKVTYTLFGTTRDVEVIGFRLEALAHESLPRKGPGRSSGGNFVLSEFFNDTATTEKLTNKHKLKFKSAKADFEQKGYPAKNAIDGSSGNGWAISPKRGQNHHIDMLLDKPLKPGQAQHIKFQMNQQYGREHALGRFRITALTDTLPLDARRALATKPDQRNTKQTAALRQRYLASHKKTAPIVAKLAKAQTSAPKEPYMNVRVLSQRENNLRTTQVLVRGNYRQRSDVVTPGTMAVLPQIQYEGDQPTRLDFANWLMDERHPLTGRVVVNQMWNTLFGKPLVTPIDDFGVRGDPPTHPQLLDWLATEYRRLGWSRKAMIKRIVTSATYRQSSNHRPELAETDPNNRLLHRQNRFRVEAETIRDLSLASAGLLTDKVGGPSVFSPVPDDLLDLAYNSSLKWNTATDANRYRRGIYTFFKRTAPDPNLITFDCPDANRTSITRMTSNTPIQALTTLNNEVFAEAAQAMARRLITEPSGLGKNDPQRAERALRLCVTRPPQTHETRQLVDYLDQARTWYRDNPSDAEAMAGPDLPEGVDTVEAAAWT